MTLEEADALCHAVAHGDQVHGEHGLGAETAVLHVPRWRGVGGFGLCQKPRAAGRRRPFSSDCWEHQRICCMGVGITEL